MMPLHVKRLCGSILAGSLIFAACGALAQDSQLTTFPTYHAAAKAFVEAQRTKDDAALVGILGSKAKDLMTSGDPAQDADGNWLILGQTAAVLSSEPPPR